MSDKISRREFLKVASLGAGASMVLTGCGPASRYVTRQPYSTMPEYMLTGQSVFFATTCGECSAGCGLIVRTTEGRAHKVEGNPAHPVNRGKTCARGQATLEGLYNPDRLQGPARRAARNAPELQTMQWDEAVGVVKDALQNNPAGSLAFLLGLFPDHLYDLVQSLAGALGVANAGPSVLRYGSLGEFEARVTLMDAAQKLFGSAKVPFFDIQRAAVTFSFGANFSETWLSPVAYTYAYGGMRQGHPGQRGYLVQFEPRMSQTAAAADEWIPILPGSEALVAQALNRLVAEILSGAVPPSLAGFDLAQASQFSGISETNLRRLARIFAEAPRQVAIPGGIALGNTNGLAAAEAILNLNVLAGNLGQDGGMFFTPDTPVFADHLHRPNTLAEISALVDRMKNGQVKVLFVHGVNPVYDLPRSLGFAEALKNVPLVISFTSFPDETALGADYVLPDHTPLEAWGYQKSITGSDRSVVSGLQPVVIPVYDTRATADVLLSAARAVGGDLASALDYTDEVDFLQRSVEGLLGQSGFYEPGPDVTTFWSRWQQYGGWWNSIPNLQAPMISDTTGINVTPAQFSGAAGEYPYYLLPFPHPNLGDGSQANRPRLQETPDPMTSVMWNTWIEINPQTAVELGLQDDDVVKVTSPVGEIEAVVYLYPAIHPGVVAIPLGQGHTSLGRYAEGRGSNPLELLDVQQNESGNLAFMATRVKVTPTGQRRPLSRYESREGVYGS